MDTQSRPVRFGLVLLAVLIIVSLIFTLVQ